MAAREPTRSVAPPRSALLVVAFASAALLPCSAHALLTNVDEANDICAPATDPCVLTQTAEIVSGAVLDFGTRALEVTGNGQLDIGSGNAAISCGRFTLATTGAAVLLSGPTPFGSTRGGLLNVTVRRQCSGNPSVVCSSNAQCAAAGAGTCTIGSGVASLGGKISGNADDPGAVVVRAAGPIAVSSSIQLNGTSLGSDGGALDLESSDAVTVTALLSASAGAQGSGGDVSIIAATDIDVSAAIDASGGDFDGGVVTLYAGRDIVVTEDVNAGATAGGGYGGEIDVNAGRDLTISGGSSLNRVSIAADGHESIDSLGGDGGTHDYYVGRDVYFGPYTRFTSDGAPPDGFGEVITIYADGNILIDGDIFARGQGIQGGGGELDLHAFGQLDVSALSAIDMTGGDGGGGIISVSSDGDLTYAGSIDASAGNGGVAGDVAIDSSADIYISGAVKLAGATSSVPSAVASTGCRLRLLAGTNIDNDADDGRNTFIARERIAIDNGAAVSADPAGGSNRITYRTLAKPPQIAGQVTPYPVLTVDRLLPGCPVCGNAEVDGGESCDDGNAIGGDGCSAECQDEGCVADTPGYPTVPLCADDNGCTVDACDAQAHVCTHELTCDDGVDCTQDSCVDAACVHVPNDMLCPSGTPCAVGFCNAVTDCVYTAVANTCDDGVFCNGADSCGGGTCSVHAGDPCTGQPDCQDLCDETADTCLAPAGTACGSDGRPCTADLCDGAGSCVHPDQDVACDDGLFCNGADFCVAGNCDVHDGDPCATAGECRDVCNETADACRTDQGVPCTDDGNFCTDDACSGSGYCSHDPYDRFSMVATKVVRKDGAANDRFAMKTVMLASAVTVTPDSSGLRLDVVDAGGTSLYSAELIAGGFVDVKGDGSLYRFRDKTGTVPGANGIFLATVKRNLARGLTYVKLKGHDVEIPGFAGKSRVLPALAFGATAGTGPCFASTYVPCKERNTSVSCRN